MNRDKTILLIFLFVGMLTMFNVPLRISAILVVIVAVIFSIAPTILKILETSSLTSKLPTTSLKTILWIVAILAAIILIILLILAIFPDSRQEIYLKDGCLVEDEFGARWICGDVEFKKIGITTESPDYRFSILGLGEKSADITVTFEDEFQKREFSFTAGNSEEIQFGASGVVYAFVNGVDLQEAGEMPKMNFFTDGQEYNVTVRIETGKSCEIWKCSRFYQRGSKVVKRNDLLDQNMIGLIKFDF